MLSGHRFGVKQYLERATASWIGCNQEIHHKDSSKNDVDNALRLGVQCVRFNPGSEPPERTAR